MNKTTNEIVLFEIEDKEITFVIQYLFAKQ